MKILRLVMALCLSFVPGCAIYYYGHNLIARAYLCGQVDGAMPLLDDSKKKEALKIRKDIGACDKVSAMAH